MMQIAGDVTDEPRRIVNRQGREQIFFDIISDGVNYEVLVYQENLHMIDERCALGAHVTITGDAAGASTHKQATKFVMQTIEYLGIPSTVTRKWNDMSEPEYLFLQMYIPEPDRFIVPQVRIPGYAIDFVVYRRSDRAPMRAIEIDDRSHDGREDHDKRRDDAIWKELGVHVEHIKASIVYSNAKAQGIL